MKSLTTLQIQLTEQIRRFAKIHQLGASRLDSGNGTQYKNFLSKTIFTAYTHGLDATNKDRIEIAYNPENLAEELGASIAAVAAHFEPLRASLPPARSKSAFKWPRFAIQNEQHALAFFKTLDLLYENPILVQLDGTIKSAPLPTRSPPQVDNQNTPSLIDETVLREILSRRGQGTFRANLLQAYRSRCAISGCTDEAVLEAAHIRPHAEEPDYRTSNGLLLRADLHTLFDLHLLSVNPQTGKISVAPELSETYRVFHNERISLPAEPDGAPDPVGLMQHFQSWLARNGQPTI